MTDYDLHENVDFSYMVDNDQVPVPFEATVGHSVYEHWVSVEMGHILVPRVERFWDWRLDDV
ncbi:hypothetical protein HVTV-2_gp169 [Haloarcula virus HVTV-2]|uniref:Uncharacterized protein n=1 Tax=Haloarcula vallismortis tailed virus 1 TaxID=1262528 RepID=L7TI62_9CAUD|nr:hypothetical protein HVTV1_167 [Haloarcula vallismortis tailed virus 1]AGC34536.1 hypothetical protein HVTV1_167 [Haloarcula vallismortis tailed virus 1]UBF22976.1 hypothetical protein HVTV-2_gp169 [Haloarcula virus HVTV-2]